MGTLNVKMTLTFPGCGMGPYMASNAREKILELDDVEEADVEMVFDPPWSPDRISEGDQEGARHRVAGSVTSASLARGRGSQAQW